jgi:lysophospholipase L1-like esterase
MGKEGSAPSPSPFDGVHPTVAGYRLMAETVMEVFSE